LSRLCLFVPILLLWCGCGFVGEPLPPLLNIPQPVANLAAVQRGSKIIVHFTLPKLTTEGVAIKPPIEWDLRIGESGPGEFHTEEWAARAKSPGEPHVEKGGFVSYEIPAAPWIGKDVVLGVRVADAHRHLSAWSNLLTLSVVQPPATPKDLKAENVPEGVRLTWSGSGPSYRVYRAGPGADFTVAANTEAREYLDRTNEYGKPVRYIVQAIVKTGTGEVESDPSKEVTKIPADEFPPAMPTGLTAVPTANSIELTWDRDTEPDLAGYRIYRGEPGGVLQKVGETAEAPSYSDRQIEAGKKYRYTVSAFDKAGNESKQSAEIEVAAP
jgi:hypothetical protein